MGGDADLLICGSCRQDFHLDNLSGFLTHKKFDCDISDQSYLSLLCQSCPEKFASPWQLLQHAQRTHAIKIYQDNRLIKQPDKTTTFTASQSYVQAMFEDGRNGTVMEYSLPKSRTYMVEYQKEEDEMVKKAESDGQSASPLKERNGSEDRQTTRTDAATQVDDPLTEEKETARDSGGYCCCSNQNCGVTVMPGTHERLKECCNAVVPKKRKRHMETKHIPSTLLRKKKFFEGTKVRRSDTGDIYIDVETSGPSDITNERENCQRQSNPDKSTSGPSPIRDAPQRTLPGPKQKSVIIQPGTTFSIPVSYAVVQQTMFHTKSRSGNTIDKPHTLTRTSAASSKVSDRPVIVDSSQIAIPMKSTGQVALPTLPFSVQSSKPILGNQPLLESHSHPVPYIANQFFSRPQEVVANNSVRSNNTEKDTSATMIDQTTNEVLTAIIAMNKEASEGANQVVVGSESGYGNNLVIDNTVNTDAIEPITERGATASSCGENQVLIDGGETSVIISEDTTQDSHGSYDLKSELVMADADASQSGDSKSMKKRRYPTSRPFKCDQCNQAFNQRIHLRKHQSKHTGIKPFKCGQCDYSTVERSHLKVHIRVHTGEKPYKCTYCEYATAQNSTLKIHLKRHHDGEGGSGLMCRTCGKKFKEQENLEVHYRQHNSVEEH